MMILIILLRILTTPVIMSITMNIMIILTIKQHKRRNNITIMIVRWRKKENKTEENVYTLNFLCVATIPITFNEYCKFPAARTQHSHWPSRKASVR